MVIRSFILFFSFIPLLSEAQDISVHLNRSNVLYRNFNNELNISLDGILKREIVVKTSDNLRYWHTDSGDFVRVLYRTYGDIYFGRLKGVDTTWLDTFRCRILDFNPFVHLCALQSSELRPVPKVAILTYGRFDGLFPIYPENYLHSKLGFGLEVISFDLIIAGCDVQKFNGLGNKLTDEMYLAIKNSGTGTKLFFTNINVKENRFNEVYLGQSFTLEMCFEHDMPEEYLLFVNTNYVNKDSHHFEHKRLTLIPEIAKEITEIENGTADFYLVDKGVICSIQRRYVGGKVKSESHFLANGVLNYRLVPLDSNVWKCNTYYPSGNLKTTTNVIKHLEYKGSKVYYKCNLFMHGLYLGFCDSIKDADQIALESVVHKFRENHYWTPMGNFESYYENGKLQCKGVFSLKTGVDVDQPISSHAGDLKYQYKDKSVMDGIWTFYNQKGRKPVRLKYQMGQLMK